MWINKEATAIQMSEEDDLWFLNSRSAISSILGYSDMLASGSFGDLNDSQRKILDEIHEAAKVLQTSLDALAKARHKQDFRKVVDSAILAMRPLAVKKRLTISLVIADGITAVEKDVGAVLVAILFAAVGASMDDATVELACWTDDNTIAMRCDHTYDSSGQTFLPFVRAKSAAENTGGTVLVEALSENVSRVIARMPR